MEEVTRVTAGGDAIERGCGVAAVAGDGVALHAHGALVVEHDLASAHGVTTGERECLEAGRRIAPKRRLPALDRGAGGAVGTVLRGLDDLEAQRGIK